MKKTLLFIALIPFAFASYAQQNEEAEIQDDLLRSKKGHLILPESGDIALGFDATPVLNFGLNLVNIMNNTGHTAQHPGYVSGFNQVIVAKYFLEDNMAVRGKLGINSLTEKTTTYFDDPLSDATTNIPELEDVYKEKNNEVIFGGGLELRRGHNRLQGFYGGELLLARSAYKETYKYGISYNQTNEDEGLVFGGANRPLDYKQTTFGLGLRGFIGVEYFFAPKMSFSAEFGWGLGFSKDSRGTETREFWDDPDGTGTNSYRTEEFQGATQVSFTGFSVDNGSSSAIFGGSAALSLLFHF